ncbi:methyltransferase domain-containing protein [Calidifontibacillus oryziterrae]|uniref:methyltransferase domain-containing protein n=1 Tax=Calidifontibacillus oryziterrae TaxID=1191699 RepID=UPI0002DFF377|nr:methyltransferase domain-containing protein [Calidifontibacillus oryziterrae]
MSKTELYTQSGVAMTCRSYQEYKEMFMFKEDLFSKGKILDIASGASSFIAELNQMEYEAIAVDPLYKLTSEEIYDLGKKEINIASQKLSQNENLFIWNNYKSLKHHDEIRNRSLNQFIDNYRKDKHKEKYIPATLPNLPFDNNTFSLVFCNHFLFLYQEQFDFKFHLDAINEMVRITKKGGLILIYPLVGFKDEIYPHLDKLIDSLNTNDVSAKINETKFRFLPSATHYLKIDK